jgi:hypothetical protein
LEFNPTKQAQLTSLVHTQKQVTSFFTSPRNPHIFYIDASARTEQRNRIYKGSKIQILLQKEATEFTSHRCHRLTAHESNERVAHKKKIHNAICETRELGVLHNANYSTSIYIDANAQTEAPNFAHPNHRARRRPRQGLRARTCSTRVCWRRGAASCRRPSAWAR